ncbi:actin-like ATPase domain-containing protein [Patellaria atrata CBS 101060]|uniref:Actin-like ATPase domain-containing protein n=1 Tax=Patellaria atrata CBS 101060 TaxID=1346257 RepID=A0A9P4S3A1_9PEZI|nr:actin-like ATPase domain-containing protein [Patellaria atrata CBS 101060]
MDDDMFDDTFLLIGIDFGTTYSGVAWAWSGRPEEINVITNWKTALNFNADNAKAPTEICYSGSEIFWGYDIAPEDEPLRWFKLLLVDEADLQPEVRNAPQILRARQLLQKLGKNVVDVVADYLRLLWQHAIESIERERGKTSVNGLPFKVVVTLPAIWKPNSQNRMHEAARKAGILDDRLCGDTQLQFVPEPEAAALATLVDFRGRSDIKKGDVFVVCDAGGGTVDIISYKIESTKPMKVKECVEGKGAMCGAIFIDQEFENMVKLTMGKMWAKLSRGSIKTMMNNEWENGIKRKYDDSDRKWNVVLPAEAFPRFARRPLDDNKHSIEQGKMQLSRGHIRSIFEGVIQQIRGLVNEQIAAVKRKEGVLPKGIMLVGGLGACNYLYQTLKTEHEPYKINVLQPRGDRPWTAICRGAAIKAMDTSNVNTDLKVLVSSRVSRFNYGVEYYTTPFIDGIHDERDRKFNAIEGCDVNAHQMEWYLKRGEDISDLAPVIMSWVRKTRWFQSRYSTSILHCEDEQPPRRRTETVKSLCDIAWKCHVPYEDLDVNINSQGEEYRQLNYDLKMTVTGASLDFTVSMAGRQLAQRNVQVDFK